MHGATVKTNILIYFICYVYALIVSIFNSNTKRYTF